MELNLRFPEINQVIVRLDELETDRLNFTSPLTAEDLEDIRWYFEVYATNYTADVDDERAKRIEDNFGLARKLHNLAAFLQNQLHRLPEARQLAEEALAIKLNLDTATPDIWKNYELLAMITYKQGDIAQTQVYRRLSRQAKAAFAGTRYELRQFGQFIAVVFEAVNDVEVRQQLEPLLEEMVKNSLVNFVAAIHLILDGERNEDALCESLNLEDSMIINSILRGIADRNTLNELLDEQG